MSLITLNATKREDFTYEEGRFEASIQAVEQTSSRSGMEMLKVTLKGDFGKNAPKTITAFMLDNKIGREQLYNLLYALDLHEESQVDTDELEGKYVGIVIKEGKPYNDKPSWNVVDYFPLDVDTDDDVDVDTDDWSDAE
jgi:hypothetical protein